MALQSDGSVSTDRAAEGPLVVAAADRLIPQRLLPLIHTEEVQAALRLTEEQLGRLERLFGELDGDWWRSRNLAEPEQRAVIEGLERRLLEGLGEWLPEKELGRLRQLELQAQSARALLRPEVAERVGLTERQRDEVRRLAEETDRAAKEASEASGKGAANAEELAGKAVRALARENEAAARELSREQQQRLAALLGSPMDLNSVSRIYPMAPELRETHGWIGEPPGSLASLRGKVVILHFYAFQCINCQRNLPRYNEWAEEFRNDDVVIIGIQTPELPAERQADRVREAAAAEKIGYPVLLDLDGENWNAWGNTMWPTVYVIDREGYIRTWWQGELNWQGATGDREIARLVRKILEKKQGRTGSRPGQAQDGRLPQPVQGRVGKVFFGPIGPRWGSIRTERPGGIIQDVEPRPIRECRTPGLAFRGSRFSS